MCTLAHCSFISRLSPRPSVAGTGRTATALDFKTVVPVLDPAAPWMVKLDRQLTTLRDVTGEVRHTPGDVWLWRHLQTLLIHKGSDLMNSSPFNIFIIRWYYREVVKSLRWGLIRALRIGPGRLYLNLYLMFSQVPDCMMWTTLSHHDELNLLKMWTEINHLSFMISARYYISHKSRHYTRGLEIYLRPSGRPLVTAVLPTSSPLPALKH